MLRELRWPCVQWALLAIVALWFVEGRPVEKAHAMPTTCHDDPKWRDAKYGDGTSSCESGPEGGIVKNPKWCTDQYGDYALDARRYCPKSCGLKAEQCQQVSRPTQAPSLADKVAALRKKAQAKAAQTNQPVAAPRAKQSPCVSATPPPFTPGNAAATTPASNSKCPGTFHPWGNHSVCLSNKPPNFTAGTFAWHCPWESMMLVSTITWGGCSVVQYDCAGMNVDAVLDHYRKHDNNKTHPPEGSLETVEYVACCIRHQCRGQPLAKCGGPPWVPGKSVSPWTVSKNPCGSEGCARRYSLTKVLNFLPKGGHPVVAVSALSMLLVAGALWSIRRRGSAHHNSYATLQCLRESDSDCEACTNAIE